MSASAEFVRLARAAGEELAELVRVGGRVEPADIVGSTWRGWNRWWGFAALGQRKFFKRFRAAGGENVLARSTPLEGPWVPRLGGKGILPFGVLPPGHGPDRAAPAHALVISYGAARGRLNPIGRIVDHVVRPDTGRPDLLLGESVLLLPGGRRVFIEHFLLERVPEP